MKKWVIGIILCAIFLGTMVSITALANGGVSFYSLLRIGNEDSFFYIGGENTSRLFIGWYYVPASPDSLHIMALDKDSVTLSWQSNAPLGIYSELRYKTTGYPTGPADGTLAYHGDITSATAENLNNGVTHYFAVWTECLGTYSDNASYVTATTSAGDSDPDFGSAIGDTTDESHLNNSPIGGLIDFVSQYGQLPKKTVGLMGYSACLLFVLVAIACYNRSVAMTIMFAIAGLALGVSLGVFAFVFLVIAIIGGLAISTLRGGQPV